MSKQFPRREFVKRIKQRSKLTQRAYQYGKEAAELPD